MCRIASPFLLRGLKESISGDARNFNNMEMQAVIKFVFLQGKALKEIHAILTETLACILPGRPKDLSAPLYTIEWQMINARSGLRSQALAWTY